MFSFKLIICNQGITEKYIFKNVNGCPYISKVDTKSLARGSKFLFMYARCMPVGDIKQLKYIKWRFTAQTLKGIERTWEMTDTGGRPLLSRTKRENGGMVLFGRQLAQLIYSLSTF